MKRYIILLALISMQANVTLPGGIWETIKSKASSIFGYYFKMNSAKPIEQVNKAVPAKIEEPGINQPKEESFQERWKRMFVQEEEAIQKFFGKKFDILVGDNLDERQRKQVSFVKNACDGYLLTLLRKNPEFNKKETIEHQGGVCVANFAQKQGEYEYKQTIDPLPSKYAKTEQEYEQYKKTKQKSGKKAFLEAYDRYKSGNSEDLTYLFKDPFGDKVIGKAIAKNNLYLSYIDPDPFMRAKSEKECRREMRFGRSSDRVSPQRVKSIYR